MNKKKNEIPTHATNGCPKGAIFMVPRITATVYIPPQGYTPDEMRAAKLAALLEAYTQAAKRGEIGVIRS